MNKLSSYQKMKKRLEAQISELQKDIHEIVLNDNLEVKMKYKVKIQIEKSIFNGSPLIEYFENEKEYPEITFKRGLIGYINM